MHQLIKYFVEKISELQNLNKIKIFPIDSSFYFLHNQIKFLYGYFEFLNNAYEKIDIL